MPRERVVRFASNKCLHHTSQIWRFSWIHSNDLEIWPSRSNSKVKLIFCLFLAKFRLWTHANYWKMVKVNFLTNDKSSIGFFLSKMILFLYVCHISAEQRAFAFFVFFSLETLKFVYLWVANIRKCYIRGTGDRIWTK